MIGTRWGGSACGATVAAVALGCGVAACGTSAGASSPSATNAAATAAPATSAAGSGGTAGYAATRAAGSDKTAASGKTAGSDKALAAGATSSSSRATAPGTKLSVGRSAKVAYTPAGAQGTGRSSTLLVTVRSIDKGALSDFNGIQLDASQKASTPFYVKVHVTNLGPHPIDVDGSAAAIEGVDDTGNNQQSVTFIGTFPRCPDSASTAPLGTGRGYDDCLTFLVPGGITKVSYNGTTDYIDSPVTWTPN